MRKNKLLLLLVLLMTVATGAWADTTVTWTASDMTDLVIDFHGGSAADNTIKGITATASGGGMGVWQGNNISMDEGSATITFTSSVGNIKSIAITAQSIYSYGGTPSGWTSPSYTKLSWSGDASPTVSMTLSDWTEISDISEIVFTIEPAPAATTYSVTLAEGTEDEGKWTIKPTEAAEGAKVTVTYSGEKKVKSVKAVKKGAAPAPSVPDFLPGVFSVSGSKKVNFSKGNLRYASSKWSFFDNQYEYYKSYSADAWDHFGWSTSATTYGMNTSTDNANYSGDFVDWGSNSDLQTALGTGWFTLTSDEWTYLFNTRSASTVGSTDNGRYAKAKVNDVQGLILFPDTYTHPDGVTVPTNVNTATASLDSNTYTVADWTKMESAGCVFLPAASSRNGSESGLGSGYYWSATPYDAVKAYNMFIGPDYLTPAFKNSRFLGFSVRLVKEVAAPAPASGTDLATITADYEAKDGETLTGTLASNVKISIADGATVTLKDVNITNLGDNCNWAGISCPGDATLVLEGTNTVCAGRDGDGYNNYPGIWIAPGKTLTIQGEGTLTAYSNGTQPFGAGIGGGYGIACGNIVINSGTITATGGWSAAGIGGGQSAGCGNITINGGTITATGGNYGPGIGSGDAGENQGTCGNITLSGGTVEATGGENAAGIGGGSTNGVCGTITITSGVTSVKATKGANAPNSIGAGDGGQDITVNIENGAKVIMAPVTVTWNGLNFNSNPYTRDGVTLTTTGNAASGNSFYDFGEKTFTNTIGKFTKIEIVCGDYNLGGWTQEKIGEYHDPEGPSFEIFKLTWTGNAESVTIPGNYVYSIQSITFYIQ